MSVMVGMVLALGDIVREGRARIHLIPRIPRCPVSDDMMGETDDVLCGIRSTPV